MFGFKEVYWIGYAGRWKRKIGQFKEIEIGFSRFGKTNWVVWNFCYGYTMRAIVLFPFCIWPASKAMRDDWRWKNNSGGRG